MTIDIPENQAVEAGIYPAILTKIETKEIEKGEYAGDTIRVWHFTVDVDGVPEKISGSTSLAFGPKSKAYEWFTNIMGRSPVWGEKGVDIIGRPCQLSLIVDEKSGYNRIQHVLPPNRGQKAAAPAVAASGASDDDLPDMDYPLEEPPLVGEGDIPR